MSMAPPFFCGELGFVVILPVFARQIGKVGPTQIFSGYDP